MPDSKPLLSWTLARMLLANGLCLAGSLMFFMLGPYLQEQGLAPWGLGASEAIFWAVSVLIQPWLGPRLDRIGRRPFFLLGVLMMASAAAAFAFIPVRVGPVLALRALQGAGFSLYLTASWSWVADEAYGRVPARVGTILGVFGLSSLVGSICGPAIAELVSLHAPHRDIFLIASAILTVAFCMLLTLRDVHVADPQTHQSLPYLALATSPGMRSATCGSLGFGLAFGCISGLGAAYLTQLHLHGIAGMFACILISAAISRVLAGMLIDRVGPVGLVVPSLLLLVVGILGLGTLAYLQAGRLALMLGAGLVAGLGYGAVYPALIALGSARMPRASRGRGLSLVTACIDLGNSSGAALAGVLANQLGYARMYLVMGAVVAGVSGLFAVLERMGKAGTRD